MARASAPNPTLDIELGGYTDNVSGDKMNQKLSENRGGAVRDYLVEQGVANESVRARDSATLGR
jgi:outer membrane protein OmpA-like peptidoglycan-associated protein